MIVEQVTDERSIRDNKSYVEALCQYEDAVTLYNAMPPNFEHDHRQAFLAVYDAFHASLQALDAIIDAHAARKVAEALLRAVHAEEADANKHAFDQALTDFGQAYTRFGNAVDSGQDGTTYEAALIAAEEKVKREAVRYARREGKRHV